MAVHFNKVTIIGVGLIGGSLAISLREAGICNNIVGVGRGVENLKTAVRLGIVDSYTTDSVQGVEDADLVVVAVPVLSTTAVIKGLLPGLKKGAIVTDVGSVKEAIIEDNKDVWPEGVFFIPGHPIAGTEHSGAEAAFSGLYKGRKTILTPTNDTDDDALKAVTEVWEAAGSCVVLMDPHTHDTVLAAISHLPHVIAYSLVNTVANIEDKFKEQGGEGGILDYSAGGFKDFTRIASSSPDMWKDICAMNKRALLDTISEFQWTLKKLKKEIETDDFDTVLKTFKRSKTVRDSISD